MLSTDSVPLSKYVAAASVNPACTVDVNASNTAVATANRTRPTGQGTRRIGTPESSSECVAVSQLVRHRNGKTRGPFRCRTELTATGRGRQSSDDSFEASVRYYGQVNRAGGIRGGHRGVPVHRICPNYNWCHVLISD